MTRRSWLIVAGVALGGMSAPVSGGARETTSELDRMTFVQFNRPVALPGVALGAGVYVFELPDPMGASGVVRVSSQDRRRVYLTTFTRIVDRPAAVTSDQPISFAEAPTHAPQPITTWWPKGESTGRQFIY
jgi:hypothetical protein